MVGARGGKVMIRDVAAGAGVSCQTVSRVLNKSPNVSPAALAKVEDAVARQGYSSSIAARRMDDRRAAAEAVEHLAALGHRRIAFISCSGEYALSSGINQPTAEMTARAAELLIGTPGKGDPGPHIIPLELIARQSSGPVRA